MTPKKVAKKGDKVLFSRKGHTIIGEVIKIKEESVIVQISPFDASQIGVQTPLTVVSHKNYEIVNHSDALIETRDIY